MSLIEGPNDFYRWLKVFRVKTGGGGPSAAAFRVYATGPTFEVQPATPTKLPFAHVDYQTGASFDTTNYSFTPAVAGPYEFALTAFWVPIVELGATTATFTFKKNGTVVQESIVDISNYRIPITVPYSGNLLITDTLETWVEFTSASGNPRELMTGIINLSLIGSLIQTGVSGEGNAVPLRTRYISPNGDDEKGTGTEEKPWRTYDTARQKIKDEGIISVNNPYVLQLDAGGNPAEECKLLPFLTINGQGNGISRLEVESEVIEYGEEFEGSTEAYNLLSNFYSEAKLTLDCSTFTSINSRIGLDCQIDGEQKFIGKELEVNSVVTGSNYVGPASEKTTIDGFTWDGFSGQYLNEYEINDTVTTTTVTLVNGLVNADFALNETEGNGASLYLYGCTPPSSISLTGLVGVGMDAISYVAPTILSGEPSILRLTPATAMRYLGVPENYTPDPEDDNSVEAQIKGIDNALGDLSSVELSTVYVDFFNGADSEAADGTQAKPWKTYVYAMAQVLARGLLSPTRKYLFIIGPGDWTEATFPTELFTEVKGSGKGVTNINVTSGGVTTSPNWEGKSGSLDIRDISFGCRPNFDLSIFTASSATITLDCDFEQATDGAGVFKSVFGSSSLNVFTGENFIDPFSNVINVTGVYWRSNGGKFTNRINFLDSTGACDVQIRNALITGKIAATETANNGIVLELINSPAANEIILDATNANKITATIDSSSYVDPTISGADVILNPAGNSKGLFCGYNPVNYTKTSDNPDGNYEGIDNALGSLGGNSINFYVYQAPHQTIPNNVITKVTLNQDSLGFNDGSYFDISLSKFLPLVSGKYIFLWNGTWDAPLSADANVTFYIYKNGSVYAQTETVTIPLNYFGRSIAISTEIELNGSTDYVEVYAKVTGNSGNALELVSTRSQTYFTGALLNQKGTLGVIPETPISNQVLLSIANMTPDWSTATYPSTTTANRILYSSATNTVSEIPTANSAVLATDPSGVPSFTNTPTVLKLKFPTSNTRIGDLAGDAITTGLENVWVGNSTGEHVTSGNGNTSVGFNTGGEINTGSFNATYGLVAGGAITSGSYNTLIGVSAAEAITTQNGITAVGYQAGQNNTGTNNTFFGYQAGSAVSSGGSNTILGYGSAATLTTGSNNIIIGDGANVGSSSATNRIAIGQGVTVSNNNQAVIGNSSCTSWISGNSGGTALGSISSPFSTIAIGATGGSAVTRIFSATMLSARQYTMPDVYKDANFEMNGGQVTVSGTTKTFALTDSFTLQRCSNASTQTLTIDTNANVAFDVNTRIDIVQEGAGQVVITGAGGVTVNSVAGTTPKITAQYGTATAIKTATNTWLVTGFISA